MLRATPIAITLLALAVLATPSYAQWWRDPFGVNQKYGELPPGQPATPEQELNAQFLYEDGVANMEAGRYSKAKKKFNEIEKYLERTEIAPDALLMKARVLREQKNFNKAFQAAQRVIIRYPDYPGFNQVIRTQFEIATAMLEGEKGKILKVIPRINNFTRARRFFEIIIRNAPFSDYAAMSLMNISMVSEQIGEEEYAIDALDRLINFYPGSMFGPDAYYMMGEVYASLVDGPFYDQSSTEEAISYFEDFLILFPDNPRNEEAEDGVVRMYEVFAQSKFLLGEFYYRYRNNTTAALVYYNETITVAPTSDSAIDAQKRIERIRDGKPPPRRGIGLAQFWNFRRGDDNQRDADLIRREQEELDEAEETEVIPAVPPPQG